MVDLGTVRPGTTLYIPFDTFALATGAPSALSNFAVGDILVYKDGNTTARASTTGYTATTSFSSVTGINLAIIDLSSDATGDFFKSGARYFVVISPVTVDGQTMAFVAATFDIGYPEAILNTSIATLSSQTSFTLTAGPAEDDALNGLWCLVHDKASAVQASWAVILDYTGSTKTVTLAATPALTFTAAAIDNIAIFGPMPLQPTVLGRALDVSTGGKAGLDWANIGSPTTAQNLSATNIDVDQIVASVSGAVGSVTGAVGSVTGAVGSVTGNVGGNVTGSVGSVVGAVGSVTAGVTLAASAVQAIWDAATSALTTVGSIGKWIIDKLDVAVSTRLASASYTAPPTANQNADALLDRTDAIETGITPRGALRISVAADAGKDSGMDTGTVKIRDVADTKDVISATTDDDGNRLSTSVNTA